MNWGRVDVFVDLIPLLPLPSIGEVDRDVQVESKETSVLQEENGEMDRDRTPVMQCDSEDLGWVKNNSNRADLDNECGDDDDCSVYNDSDDPSCSVADSEEEDCVSEEHPKRKKTLKKPSDPKCESQELEVGMLFDDGKQFKSALIKYAVMNKKDVKWIKNESLRVQARCSTRVQAGC
ncbi:unnamed protein product [Cuscuta epithymum]|uniref:Transposase MuDR plant domain-containing protein n=1 Tax=Cuscuta epithymum TaxID=186058 RepID=A0AAV0EAU2_9ASTE|nr:unnamed protein product [Cuscuta epithymum]